jgi:hypothetical protein
MAVSASERKNAPLRFPAPVRRPSAVRPPRLIVKAKKKFALLVTSFAGIVSGLWAGAVGAYVVGYAGAEGLPNIDSQQVAIFVISAILPPVLFMMIAWLLVRGLAMGEAAQAFADATHALFSADETVAGTSAELGRAVRREIDALNTGLDNALGRMHALEGVLHGQIAALDDASARAGVRGETLAARLSQERAQIESAAGSASNSAAEAGKTMAGGAAQLKAAIETAQNSLKNASAALAGQIADFHLTVSAIGEAPHAFAVELEKQAKAIAEISESATTRTELLLGREEHHRAAMNELSQRLSEQGATFDATLKAEREAMEKAVVMLEGEVKKHQALTGESGRQLETLMAGAETRAGQMTETFLNEAKRLQAAGDAANAMISQLAAVMRKAGGDAQAAIDATAGKAKANAGALVETTMAQCNALLQSAGKLSAQAKETQAALIRTANEMRSQLAALPVIASEETAKTRETVKAETEAMRAHIESLPVVAEAEAAKVRETVRKETDEMLALSARTLATMHARGPARTPQPAEPEESMDTAGLGFFKRRVASSRPHRSRDGKDWQMSTLLAAAENQKPSGKGDPSGVGALGVLETVLADLAIDLDAIVPDVGPRDKDWHRYLAGDRSVFARKLAAVIDGESVHRIAVLYRENASFRDSANAYMDEFEAMLNEARGGKKGLLASTLVTSDAGKIYLAISYALGRV